MSAKNKVNPDHYKTGHPGEPRESPKDTAAPVKRRNRKSAEEPNFIPGAAPVGESADTDDEPGDE
jgi:hypothetical protein